MTALLGIIVLGVGLGASLFLPVPQTLKTNFDAGQSLYALGEYEGAIIEYSKVVQFDSRAVREDSIFVDYGDELQLPILSAAWYQLGNAYKRSGEHDSAVKAFHHVTEAIGVSEDFRSLVQFQVAETRFLQQQYEESSKEYDRYVELFPKSDLAGQAYFYSGWSQFNQKLYDDAIGTLGGMLNAYPDNNYAPDAQFRIASSFFEKEDYARSIDEAKAVIERYPESLVIAQAIYLEANAHDKLGVFRRPSTPTGKCETSTTVCLNYCGGPSAKGKTSTLRTTASSSKPLRCAWPRFTVMRENSRTPTRS